MFKYQFAYRMQEEWVRKDAGVLLKISIVIRDFTNIMAAWTRMVAVENKRSGQVGKI